METGDSSRFMNVELICAAKPNQFTIHISYQTSFTYSGRINRSGCIFGCFPLPVDKADVTEIQVRSPTVFLQRPALWVVMCSLHEMNACSGDDVCLSAPLKSRTAGRIFTKLDMEFCH